MSLLGDPAFLAAGLAHFGVDLLNSQKSLVLAFLSTPLGLTNSLIGFINTLYTLSASLAQPLFGMLADRIGSRWVVTAGVAWLSLSFAAAVMAPGYWALGLLVLAGIGSAAFHPAGAMEATVRGQQRYVGRETTAASMFFFFGQAGLAIGPALGGPLLDRWGMVGLAVLPLLVVPAGFNAAWRIETPTAAAAKERAESKRARMDWSGPLLAGFIVVAAGRTWLQFNFLTFLPKYFHDLGMNPGQYGLMAALFMAASALGNVSGGWLGDRIDRNWIVRLSLLAAAAPTALYPLAGAGLWILLLTPLAGALIGANHSIVVVTAQNMMPDRMGAASGLVLGFMFTAGSLGTLLSGWIADHFGFSAFFLATAALALGVGLLSWTLPFQAKSR
jgi:FSR family fosmidomycin resistance protein-like MFS transporter